MEQTIGPGGTATAECFDDISGTSTLTAFVATRNETVTAGFQQTFTVPPAGLGSEPLRLRSGQAWGVRYQIWLTVPTTDSYRLAVYADDGFSLNGQGLSLSNATPRDVTTTEASTVLTLTPGAIYNFALTYLNYSGKTTNALQLWRRSGGPLELVPSEALHARGRRDYYSFGGAVVAMKEGLMNSVTRTLSYLHGDHLGSVSLTTNASGQKVSEQRYTPYGEVRWVSGAGMPTDKQFTGQTRLAEGYVGTLYDYVARAYDPVLGRFISADTIVPGAGNGQALNRYMYVRGNPLQFSDPTGHYEACDDGVCADQGSTRNGTPVGGINTGNVVQYPPLDGDHVVTGYYGTSIDTKHADPGVAKTAIKQVADCYLKGGSACDVTILLTQDSKSLGRFHFPPGCASTCEFPVRYHIKSGFLAVDITGIALAIYLDAQVRFEYAQGTIDYPFNSTSFHFEDLPSDYLAFYSAVSGEPLTKIVSKYFGGQQGTISEIVSFAQGFRFKSYYYDRMFAPGQGIYGLFYPLPGGLAISLASRQTWTFTSQPQYGPFCGTNCR